MITIEKKVNQNIITICNYEEYQTNILLKTLKKIKIWQKDL